MAADDPPNPIDELSRRFEAELLQGDSPSIDIAVGDLVCSSLFNLLILAIVDLLRPTLVALATSLPELVATVAAVRIGAHELAIGNIFGVFIGLWLVYVAR